MRRLTCTEMFKLLILLGVIASVLASYGEEHFKVHSEKHNLKFASADEFSRRLSIYQDNMAKIDAHNAEAAAGKHGYTQGPGPFTHMTSEEFAEYTSRGVPKGKKPEDLQKIHDSMPVHDVTPESRKLLESVGDWDWRTIGGVVTPVKNQGQCGSCWTFGAAGALEGAYALFSGAGNSFTPTRTAYDATYMSPSTGFFGFSEQNFLDCDNQMSDGCNGGWPETAWMYAAQQEGVPSEYRYPYVDIPGPSDPPQTCYHAAPGQDWIIPNSATRKDLPYSNVAPYSQAALQTALFQQPVQIVVQAGPSFTGANSPWQHYNGGIISVDDGCDQVLDHSVLAVGYHDSSVSGQSYWIVKNSWTDTWGVGGYIYIEKSDRNSCGVLCMPTYPNMAGVSTNPIFVAGSPTASPTMPSAGDLTSYTAYDNVFVPSLSSKSSIFTETATSMNNVIAPGVQTVIDVNMISVYSIDVVLNLNPNNILPSGNPNTDSLTSIGIAPVCAGYQEDSNGDVGILFYTGITAHDDFENSYTYVIAFAGYVNGTDASGDTLVGFTTINAQYFENWDLPLTRNNLLQYGGAINPKSPNAVNTMNSPTDLGIGIKNVKFQMVGNYPTQVPTPVPPPTPPVPHGGSVMGSLTKSMHGDSACASPPIGQSLTTFGLCHYDQISSSWSITVPGTPLVTNPTDPWKVPIYKSYYTDNTCKVETSKEASSFFTTNTCVLLSAGLNLYEKSQWEDHITAGKPELPYVIPGNQLTKYVYKDQAHCIAKDATGIVEINNLLDTTSTGCESSTGTMTFCDSDAVVFDIFTSKICDGNPKYSEKLWSLPVSNCALSSSGGDSTWYSTCTSGGSGASTSSVSASASTYKVTSTVLGLSIACAVLLIIAGWFYTSYKSNMKMVAATNAKLGSGANPIHNTM